MPTAVPIPAFPEAPSGPIPCPVCAASATEPVLAHPLGKFVRCPSCGLIRLDPLPSRDTVAFLYSDLRARSETFYMTKPERKLRRALGRVRQIRSRLGGDPRGRRFLDVGASGGFICEAARRAGFEPLGVEPDPHSVAWAREHYPGIRLVNGFIEDVALEPESFDAVYCSEVIEHSADCNRFLAAIAAAMKPGALLYLTTPDIFHWRQPRDLTKRNGFDPPWHCLYFSPTTLTRLLANHGLRVVHRRLAWKPGIKLFARKETR